jgi:hypothetical protein
MPYFFILPAFVAYFITMVVAINVAVLCRPAGHLRRYLASFLIWSSLGFVASTVVYAIMLVVSAKVWGQITAGKSSIAGGVAPFVAAAAGLIGGGIFGLWKCLSKCKPLA